MTERSSVRFVRALALGAVALVLLGLVAVAAGGYRFGRPTSQHGSTYAVDLLLTIAIALYVVAAAAAFVGLFWAGLDVRRARARKGPERRRRARNAVILIALLGALLVRSQLRIHFGSHRSSDQPPAAATAGSGNARAHKSHDQQFKPVPFAIIVTGAGLAAAAFVVAESRRRRRLPKGWAAPEELAEVLDDTLETLRAEADPRRAVIRAYARMERLLATRGLERRGSEAPHEYLRRVLADVTGSAGAARRLTDLFEHARFSPHEVDAAMKQQAIEAVEELQQELELVAAAAEPEAA